MNTLLAGSLPCARRRYPARLGTLGEAFERRDEALRLARMPAQRARVVELARDAVDSGAMDARTPTSLNCSATMPPGTSDFMRAHCWKGRRPASPAGRSISRSVMSTKHCHCFGHSSCFRRSSPGWCSRRASGARVPMRLRPARPLTARWMWPSNCDVPATTRRCARRFGSRCARLSISR